jgi:phage-related minor tail protein
MVADITAKLRTIEKSMLLKFSHCFPNNFSTFAVFVAAMREFTKINAISDNFVNFLQEITSILTIWAADIIAWSDTHASCFILPIS